MHHRSMKIRPAALAERDRLTEIALAAKRFWGYPEAWIELWRVELAYTPERFSSEEIFVAEHDGEVVGVCSLRASGEEAEIEGLWVWPGSMRRGVGRALMEQAIALGRARGIRRLGINADPQAEPFYLKMGAVRLGVTPSRPAGRELPRLILDLGPVGAT